MVDLRGESTDLASESMEAGCAAERAISLSRPHILVVEPVHDKFLHRFCGIVEFGFASFSPWLDLSHLRGDELQASDLRKCLTQDTRVIFAPTSKNSRMILI